MHTKKISSNIKSVLQRQTPQRLVFAPNFWQWFAHHKYHNKLPPEIADCRTQLDMIKYLQMDVFSRNIYCNQQQCWFGGLAGCVFNSVDVSTQEQQDGKDRIFTKTYHTSRGTLTERLRYVFEDSTLVQEEFLINDYKSQLDAFEQLLLDQQWEFSTENYAAEQRKVGPDGVVVAGELYSPLKMLHFAMGPIDTTYLLMDHPDRVMELLGIHERAQLDLVEQIAAAGVPAIMSMDNLDTMFHPPNQVEKYSASFYEKAAGVCHSHGSNFFIHACGQQKDNLKLISSLGVDGLEGVAYPPLGDVELDEVMELTTDRFIITGGISASETTNLTTKKQIFDYIEQLFRKMRPYKHRFMLSASCNTAIETPWDTIKYFRDAWIKFR